MKNNELEIPEGAPLANDKLNRKPLLAAFMDIVNFYADRGCVIALNGEWGTGKTTFAQMAMEQLRMKGGKPLYFNAWENDFVSDPFIALLAELKSLSKSNNQKLRKVLTTGAKVGVDIVSNIAVSCIKNVTGADLKEISKTISDSIKQEINDYKGQKQTFDDFKKALSEYVAFYSKEDAPVVFFVDELDRCRPDFAVKVLERIKHLFDIPNLVFVLVMNKKQFEYAIQGFYGSDNIDANNYLRRFIDLEFCLPNVDKKAYLDNLYECYGFEKVFNNYFRYYSETLQRDTLLYMDMRAVMSHSKIDLRTLDKTYAHTALVIRSFGERARIYPDLVLLLLLFKFENPELYRLLSKKGNDIQKIINETEKFLDSHFIDRNIGEINILSGIMAQIIAMYRKGENNETKLPPLTFTLIREDIFSAHYNELCSANACMPIRFLIEKIELHTKLIKINEDDIEEQIRRVIEE